MVLLTASGSGVKKRLSSSLLQVGQFVSSGTTPPPQNFKTNRADPKDKYRHAMQKPSRIRSFLRYSTGIDHLLTLLSA